MHHEDFKKLLEGIAAGSCSVDEGMKVLKELPYLDIGLAKCDTHRSLRNQLSEVILGEGKSFEQILAITAEIVKRGHNVLATRIPAAMGPDLLKQYPQAVYDALSRSFKIMQRPAPSRPGNLVILCAGTADLPVAEEARHTAAFFGVEARCVYDVGVAGLHRLLSQLEDIQKAEVVICVAGMEGALPSILGGLIPCPILAVPTSVGYGTNLKGWSALLTMLNSCSEGIAVVNIDNGFGAACAALRILQKRSG